jgi:hypothetical protein
MGNPAATLAAAAGGVQKYFDWARIFFLEGEI